MRRYASPGRWAIAKSFGLDAATRSKNNATRKIAQTPERRGGVRALTFGVVLGIMGVDSGVWEGFGGMP